MKIGLFLLRWAAMLVVILAAALPPGLAVSQASVPPAGTPEPARHLANVRGKVTSKVGRVPLAGVRVEISSLGLAALTDANGQFFWNNISLKTDLTPVDIRVTAPGYEPWLKKDALLRQDDTLILSIDLKEDPGLSNGPGAAGIFSIAAVPESDNHLQKTSAQTQVQDALPSAIRVGITGDLICDPLITTTYTVRTVDFKTYVKHVLPNEWVHTWGREALRAGAVAVKMYAWYWILHGGKWSGTDMIDTTCDQVYDPAVEYESTNQAVDFTWYWKLTRQGGIFQTFHKAMENCDPPTCMNQTESARLAAYGYTWDAILTHFYTGSQLSLINPGVNPYALRFNGAPGDGQLDNRVVIPLVDACDQASSMMVNVGSSDFTVEWWLKASPEENSSGPVACGNNQSWTQGNIILDRSQTSVGGGFGVSLAKGHLVFGVTGPDGESLTLCGARLLADNLWHHIAIQRRQADGMLWMFVDGSLDGFAAGPPGDISYQTGQLAPAAFDPFLFLGGGKDYGGNLPHPFYQGWMDELRFSRILRYPVRGSFRPPEGPFSPDEYTLSLYHFDDGIGWTVLDSSSANNGRRYYGGRFYGPEWLPSTLFIKQYQYIPLVRNEG